jgi:hypothetical protein
MKDGLESKTKMIVSARHPLMPWIVEYAGHLLNRFEVSQDGKTAYERLKGKSARTLGIEFGESILWKRRAVGGALAKATCLWEDGIFLGVRGASGEIIVGDEKGVWKTRSVQRKSPSERWAEGALEVIRHVPWRVSDEDPNMDGEKLQLEGVSRKLEEPEVQLQKDVAVAPSRFMIRKEDLERHGYSANCPGCKSILRGTARQGHSESCRKRLEEELKDDPRIKLQRIKEKEYVERRLEEQERKRRKKEEDAKMEGDEGTTAEPSSAAPTLTERASASNGPSVFEQVPPASVDAPMEESGEKRSMTLEELAQKLKQSKKVRVAPVEGGHPEEDFLMQCLKTLEDLEKSIGSVSCSTDGGEDLPCERRIHHVLQEGGAEMWGSINQEHDEQAWLQEDLETCDTKTGDVLDPTLVREARREEIEYMRSIGLYTKVSISECWEKTGKAPITTKWVDVNKGSSQNPDIRCRLVARDFKVKGEGSRDDLFASMPPLEAKRLLFKMAAATWGGSDPTKIMLVDVKKAHLNGKVGEEIWACIELPEEDAEPGMCGRLVRWLYGMRPAAKAWEEDYAAKLMGAGFRRGVASPTCFFHPSWGMRIVVHGDDFTITGKQRHLNEFARLMGSWYLMTVKGTLGPETGDSRVLRILNRKLWIDDNALVYEADEKHARVLCEHFGLGSDSKGLDSPAAKSEVNEDDPPLEGGEVTEFRGLAARASYLSLDRIDLMFAAKEVCREMAAPRASSWGKLKRLARYVLAHPRAEWRFPFGVFSTMNLKVHSDSDWAGCRATRKSTSGGMISIDGTALKAWSSTQATVATSSGEAELQALVKAASEGLGMQSVASDLGLNLQLEVIVDSSAAQSIASRCGLGRTKHLEVKYLWVQQAVALGRFKVGRVPGEFNPADVVTKPHNVSRFREMLEPFGFKIRGRGLNQVLSLGRWADFEPDDVDFSCFNFGPPDPEGSAGGGGVLGHRYTVMSPPRSVSLHDLRMPQHWL